MAAVGEKKLRNPPELLKAGIAPFRRMSPNHKECGIPHRLIIPRKSVVPVDSGRGFVITAHGEIGKSGGNPQVESKQNRPDSEV